MTDLASAQAEERGLLRALGDEANAFRPQLAELVDALAQERGMVRALSDEANAFRHQSAELTEAVARERGMVRALEPEEANSFRRRIAELSDALARERDAAQGAQAALREVQARLEPIEPGLAREAASREALAGAVQTEAHARAALEQRFDPAERLLERLRVEIAQTQSRVSLLLEEARRRLPEPFSEEQLHGLSDEDRHAFDALYVALEDQFRGSREDVKERARTSLPGDRGGGRRERARADPRPGVRPRRMARAAAREGPGRPRRRPEPRGRRELPRARGSRSRRPTCSTTCASCRLRASAPSPPSTSPSTCRSSASSPCSTRWCAC